jgi:hypothetical protein
MRTSHLSSYNMLEDMMYLHICREDGVAATNQNSDFLCSCFCSLTRRVHNIQHLSYIIHVPQSCSPSATCVILQLFTTAIKPVMPHKHLGPEHCSPHTVENFCSVSVTDFRNHRHTFMWSISLSVKPFMLCRLLPVTVGGVFVLTCCNFAIFISFP